MEFIRERIEHRAYDLYLMRGKIPGFHEEDWKQAEKEVLAEIEAGKKKEAERRAAVKAAPALIPAPKESKPVSEKAQPKTKAPSSVKPAAKVIKKKK